MSHGKAVSCAVYETRDASATMIFLRGSSPADLALAKLQAHFFADHGFRVLLPDYFSATTSAETTAANYRRWAQVAEDIVAELHAQSRTAKQENRPCRARLWEPLSPWWPPLKRSTSMLSRNGLACSPTNSFPRCKACPRCSSCMASRISRSQSSTPASLFASASSKTSPATLKSIPPKATFLPRTATDSANQRTLAFFRTYLWASLPKRAE